MESTILAETEAFVARQREALLNQRQELLAQQSALQQQIDQLDQMLTKFDVFEGKYAKRRGTRKAGAKRASSGRRGSRREELMKVIKAGHGLTRGEILEKMGLKGNKSGEMSVSNALTALTKSNQVRRDGRKYLTA